VSANNELEGLVCGTNGTIQDFEVGLSGYTLTDISPVSYSPTVDDRPFTFAETNNVIYVNRADRRPWYFNKGSSTTFTELPTGTGEFPSDWRAGIIRASHGMVLIYNLVQGAVDAPTAVGWSSFSSWDTLPEDWDFSDTTSSAGYNYLQELTEPITDAQLLNEDIFIYSANQTWVQRFIGGNDIWEFHRVWLNRGAINANCSVEVNGQHYVFGSKDLWTHDGVRQDSLSNNKIRKFVFNGLINDRKDQCFVVDNYRLGEVWYCYPSADQYVRFSADDSTTGCNRIAAWNYISNTWTFYDAPFITGSCFAKVSQATLTWEDIETAWEDTSGSWSAQADEAVTAFYVGMVSVDATDLSNDASLAVVGTYNDAGAFGAVDNTLTSPGIMYKTGMDLDELQEELRGYKLVSSVYPEIAMFSPDEGLFFTLGSSDHPSEAPVWGNSQVFDTANYKLDHNIAGRYLHLKIESPTTGGWEWTGVDMDITSLGRR
jgi:hypothetical protein